jgi:hypothetical protein
MTCFVEVANRPAEYTLTNEQIANLAVQMRISNARESNWLIGSLKYFWYISVGRWTDPAKHALAWEITRLRLARN